MVSGPSLQQQLDQMVQEIKQAVSGLSEEQASKEPAQGEWSAKQVLSHLCGADDALSMYEFKRFLSEDTPPLGITPGQYSDIRKDAPVPELLSKVESEPLRCDSTSFALHSPCAGGFDASSSLRPETACLISRTFWSSCC